MTMKTGFQRAFSHAVAVLNRAGIARVPGARQAYARVHRLVFPGGERRVFANGLPMWVDTRDRVIATHLLGEGVWEPSETTAFLAHLREGMCVFDVGANIGYYTLLAARAVGSSGRVWAFEPEPHNFALLTRNVAENGFANVQLVNAAVSDRAGVLRLHLDDANFGAHSLEAGSVRTSSGRSVDVDAVFLDRFADEALSFGAGILVKVDVQGAEALVVAGAHRLLGLPNVTLFLEIWPEALERAQADAGRLLAALEDLGFRFEDVEAPESTRRALRPAEILETCRARTQNWMNLLLSKPGPP
ncbi:MAG: FkbM family methyltransferase [Acidobacteria bacterium]|nr:FkbM family methyltransferase [Acidobacteriota bacterium]